MENTEGFHAWNNQQDKMYSKDNYSIDLKDQRLKTGKQTESTAIICNRNKKNLPQSGRNGYKSYHSESRSSDFLNRGNE